jgi:hypothetical protein
VLENDDCEGVNSATTHRVINVLSSSLGSSGGLFIEVVKESGNNIRTTPITVPFTLSAQS